MGGAMTLLNPSRLRALRTGLIVVSALLSLFTLHAVLIPAGSPLLSADQRAARLFATKDYTKAAATFESSVWRAAALYAGGEFKAVVPLLTGSDTPEAHYNAGNALCMQGLYADAIPPYTEALLGRPGWDEATVNLEVARQGAARTRRDGGEQGSEVGADKIVFDKKDPSKGMESKPQQLDAPGSDAAMRAMWLRQVQTTPAQFLSTKFAYQVHARKTQPEGDGK
jgi:Ca-activated chloride channel family protein